MRAEMPVSPEGQTDSPYYDFRFPFQLDKLPDTERHAVKAFCQAVCRQLGQPSYHFYVDSNGELLIRRSNSSANAACIGDAPQHVYQVLSGAFVDLGLQRPPLFERFPAIQ